MWDWVGGRTSEFSAVGLVPAALQGLDVDSLLAGAAACDEVTRIPEVERNPSALLALMWYHATDGRGMPPGSVGTTLVVGCTVRQMLTDS